MHASSNLARHHKIAFSLSLSLRAATIQAEAARLLLASHGDNFS